MVRTENWQKEWYGKMYQAKFAIIMLSDAYWERSSPCRDEVEAILQRGIPIFSIRIDNTCHTCMKGNFLGDSDDQMTTAGFLKVKLGSLNCFPPPHKPLFQVRCDAKCLYCNLSQIVDATKAVGSCCVVHNDRSSSSCGLPRLDPFSARFFQDEFDTNAAELVAMILAKVNNLSLHQPGHEHGSTPAKPRHNATETPMEFANMHTNAEAAKGAAAVTKFAMSIQTWPKDYKKHFEKMLKEPDGWKQMCRDLVAHCAGAPTDKKDEASRVISGASYSLQCEIIDIMH
eukprot:SAG31_NODE_10025_length_1194_cov_0.950685_2_plen_285_part_01